MRIQVNEDGAAIDGIQLEIGWRRCAKCKQTTLYDDGIDVLFCPWCNQFLEAPCTCRDDCPYRPEYERRGKPRAPLSSPLSPSEVGADALRAEAVDPTPTPRTPLFTGDDLLGWIRRRVVQFLTQPPSPGPRSPRHRR